MTKDEQIEWDEAQLLKEIRRRDPKTGNFILTGAEAGARIANFRNKLTGLYYDKIALIETEIDPEDMKLGLETNT